MTRFACFLLYEYPTEIPAEVCAIAKSKMEAICLKYPTAQVQSHFNGVKFSTYFSSDTVEAKLALRDYFADVGFPSGFTSFNNDDEDIVDVVLKHFGKNTALISGEIYKKQVI